MLKLNVGLTKKVGEPNYSSKGASVNVELEIDSGIIGEPERLRERIRQLFAIARSSVEEELYGHSQGTSGRNGSSTNGNGNGHTNRSGYGRQRDATRRATASQARALHLIADRQGVNLAGVLRQQYGVDQAGDLTITEASALIDQLKAQTNGNGLASRR